MSCDTVIQYPLAPVAVWHHIVLMSDTNRSSQEVAMKPSASTKPVVKSEEEWREQLSPEAFKVARKHGTERAFSHAYNAEKRDGTYVCVCCDTPLFTSDAKFDSGTGWPSYFKPIDPAAVDEHEDNSFFSRRTEVRCATCDAHLGHVFPDGPRPTGLRYCMNGVALKFDPKAG
jgi:peptide-methionine (R)-S-oxide reductase